MIHFFNDNDFLLERKRELFAQPGWAFTDMGAFDYYSRKKNAGGVYLEPYFDRWRFDDAICQFASVFGQKRNHGATRLDGVWT
jgi:hypothetical protein